MLKSSGAMIFLIRRRFELSMTTIRSADAASSFVILWAEWRPYGMPFSLSFAAAGG